MIQEFFSDKWSGMKIGFVGNALQVATIAYVCYLCYFAACMYFSNDKEKLYPKTFFFTASYIVIRLLGSVVWGVV